ncbi:hypothetical protein RUE5091_00837 [Ruegeria denitrificans]|uniref:Uncharacterized protein n=1 Tax=Ruegeria denitrificans TaxID=1715692 RepID=A0A0P1ICI9_9RHOB|nr:hypothetical protein RUE5091_00837 [Ruegeria denitrificans]
MTGRICDRQGLYETSGYAGGSCTIWSSHQEPCVKGNCWMNRALWGCLMARMLTRQRCVWVHMALDQGNVKLTGRYDGLSAFCVAQRAELRLWPVYKGKPTAWLTVRPVLTAL